MTESKPQVRSRRRKRTILRMLLVAAFTALTLGSMAGNAHAVSNSYWVPTETVTLGSCMGTTKLKPGVYIQPCTRLVSTGIYTVSFQNYMVVTNTGTSTQYIHVPDSLQHVDYFNSVGSREGSEDTSTGGCYTTAIYANDSLTCRSDITTYKVGIGDLTSLRVESWARIHLEVTGTDYGWWYTPTVSS